MSFEASAARDDFYASVGDRRVEDFREEPLPPLEAGPTLMAKLLASTVIAALLFLAIATGILMARWIAPTPKPVSKQTVAAPPAPIVSPAPSPTATPKAAAPSQVRPATVKKKANASSAGIRNKKKLAKKRVTRSARR